VDFHDLLIFSDVLLFLLPPWEVGLCNLIFWLASRSLETWSGGLISCWILVLRAFPADTSIDGSHVLRILLQWIGLSILYTLCHIHTWYWDPICLLVLSHLSLALACEKSS
jgi:hypothetical protein